MEEPLPVLTSWPTTAVSENQNTVKALTTQATHNNIEDRLTFGRKEILCWKKLSGFKLIADCGSICHSCERGLDLVSFLSKAHQKVKYFLLEKVFWQNRVLAYWPSKTNSNKKEQIFLKHILPRPNLRALACKATPVIRIVTYFVSRSISTGFRNSLSQTFHFIFHICKVKVGYIFFPLLL